MLEILFVFVIVFVAYVFCCALSNKPTSTSSEIKTPTVETANTTEPEQPLVKPTATKANHQKKGLKNPATGEVVSNYSNYTFAKRWIKEALVSEGLLDKIYKNNELTPEIEANIKSAIAQLAAMDKYKV